MPGDLISDDNYEELSLRATTYLGAKTTEENSATGTPFIMRYVRGAVYLFN